MKTTLVPHRDEQGLLVSYDGLIQDITERKQTEQTLRTEQEMAEHYLTVAEVILVAFDTEAHVTMLNRKGYSVLGYEDGELLGQDWFRACLPPAEYDRVSGVFRHILLGDLEPVEYYENDILRKDGERRLIAWHNSILKNDAGKITGILSSGEDITERKRAEKEKALLEAQLQQSQKMESLGLLAGGVAHDMNNVLGAILGLASANIDGQGAGSKAHLAFETIIKAAERGGKRVKSLLNLVQSSILEVLEVLGHKASAARSGEEALAKLRAGLRPDVVILDINMPGLGGAETMPRLRALCPAVPVLLATGRADQVAQDLIDAYPFVTLLPKPFSLRELQRHLDSFGPRIRCGEFTQRSASTTQEQTQATREITSMVQEVKRVGEKLLKMAKHEEMAP